MSLRAEVVNLFADHARKLAPGPVLNFEVGRADDQAITGNNSYAQTVTSDQFNTPFIVHSSFLASKLDTGLENPRLIQADDLSPAEANKLETDTKRLLGITDLSTDKFECEMALRSSLPDHTLDKLEDFSAGNLGATSLYLRGFPICPQTDQILLGAGQVLGNCFVETSETPQIVQHVSPKAKEEHLQTSSSSKVPLYMHVENVGTDRVPDWVGILCERNHERAQTTIVDPVEVMNQMLIDGKINEVAYLWEPMFWIQTPASFGSGRKRTYGHSVFSGDLNRPSAKADFADMGSTSIQHANAFELFRDYCEDRAASVCLNPGDVLFMRNTGSKDPAKNHLQCMHGRGRFTPHSEPGLQRLLKRVFVQDRISA